MTYFCNDNPTLSAASLSLTELQAAGSVEGK